MNIDDAIKIELQLEGLRSDEAGDPGGDTVMGIARSRHPDEPWPPSPARVVEIYQKEYWDANRCGEMPPAWALSVFDADVNMGDGEAAMLVQAALGLKADGSIGPVTLAAIRAATDEALDVFYALRALAYVKMSRFPVDGKGWLKRTYAVRRMSAVAQ